MRVALLHGFAGDPAAWDAVIAAPVLRADVRAIALPGHGGGDVVPTWDANLELVARSIDDVDVVVGYSLGARVALGLVATERAARAILISVNPGIADGERAARRASDAAWARVLRDRGIDGFLDAWEAQPLFATQHRVPDERRQARRRRRRALDPEQLARSLEVMGLAEMPDYRAAIAGGRCVLVAGADDPKYLAIARSVATPVEVPVEVIDGSGHDPTLEQPAALALLVARWA